MQASAVQGPDCWAPRRAAAHRGGAGRAGPAGHAQEPTPRQPEYGDLVKLRYVNAVLRESLRLLPVSALGPQRITSAPATDMGGYAVPAHTEILVRAQPSSSILEPSRCFRL